MAWFFPTFFMVLPGITHKVSHLLFQATQPLLLMMLHNTRFFPRISVVMQIQYMLLLLLLATPILMLLPGLILMLPGLILMLAGQILVAHQILAA